MVVQDDPTRRIENLLASEEPRLADAFLRMVAAIKGALTLSEIATFIERGHWDDALVTALRAVPTIGDAWIDSFTTAARDTAKLLGRQLGEVVIVFDQTNVNAVNMMNSNRLRLITAFTESQRDATRTALAEGIARGANPREMARDFRDSIGLTARQWGYVRNYRRALEQLDSAALRRELRDRRFDPTVRAALRDETPLTRQQIDAMVTRYTDRFIAHRAEVIARTEALRSVHEGAELMYDQAITAGDLSANDLIREWNTARDERVRSSHKAMHGQKRGYGEAFESGDGYRLRYPGDPNAPGSETIQCRCVVGTRIASLVPA